MPELSLVAEADNKIVAHILFTKVKIGNSVELALAPLSVLPEHQKQAFDWFVAESTRINQPKLS